MARLRRLPPPPPRSRGLVRSRRLKTPAICYESADNKKHPGNAGTHGKLRVSTRDHAQVHGALEVVGGPVRQRLPDDSHRMVPGELAGRDLAGILVDVLGPSCPDNGRRILLSKHVGCAPPSPVRLRDEPP